MSVQNVAAKTAATRDVEKLRSATLKRFEKTPVREAIVSLRTQLATETDERLRLGLLSARVELVRRQTAQIREMDGHTAAPRIRRNDADPASTEAQAGTSSDTHDNSKTRAAGIVMPDDPQTPPSGWQRLRVTETTVVNGVRFPAGVQIEVSQDDADRLVEANLAERLDIPAQTAETKTEKPAPAKRTARKKPAPKASGAT